MKNPLSVVLPLLSLVLATACSDQAELQAGSGDDLEGQLENFFGMLDANGDGRIERDELATDSMSFQNQNTGESLTGEAAGDAWFEMFDVSGDGEVTLQEYISKGLELDSRSG